MGLANGSNLLKINNTASFGDNHLVIDENGNVGIGTSGPQSLLSVNGKITAKEVQVTTSGWADFVFEENYKLLSLAEVENHIKKNKHLPEVPSAKEVKEAGINLGEMDAKLLQKIEELTLYIIQQDKRIETLERKINQK